MITSTFKIIFTLILCFPFPHNQFDFHPNNDFSSMYVIFFSPRTSFKLECCTTFFFKYFLDSGTNLFLYTQHLIALHRKMLPKITLASFKQARSSHE